jgi:hypothetical protein
MAPLSLERVVRLVARFREEVGGHRTETRGDTLAEVARCLDTVGALRMR